LLEPGGALWRWHREFVARDGKAFRRDYGHWPGIDATTYASLVAWADRDGATLSFDASRRARDGELPVWLLDREGSVAVLAARSLPELVERFLLGGAIDRYLPPCRGGRWAMRDAYQTRPRRWHDAARAAGETAAAWWARIAPLRDGEAFPPYAELAVAALARGDETEARALRKALFDGLVGYEAGQMLLDALAGDGARDVEPGVLAAWLEDALALCERFCPGADRSAAEARLRRARAEGGATRAP
jgi:hypothetical protein